MFSAVLAGWLALLAVLIFYRLVTGGIRTQGLLSRVIDGRPVPERVQILVSSVVVIVGYALTVLQEVSNATTPLKSLPDVPTELIVIFAGSQAIYLSGKLSR